MRRGVSAAEQKRANRFLKAKEVDVKREKQPMKALKMQRALASVSYGVRGTVKKALEERENEFEALGLLEVVREGVTAQALGGLVEVSPTPIQRLAIPALLGMEEGVPRRRRRKEVEEVSGEGMQQFLLAAETGSGKTLAYVLPLLDSLKRAEKVEAEEARSALAQQAKEAAEASPLQRLELASPPLSNAPHPTNSSTARPRILILLPTAELVAQVGSLLKTLSHTIKFRTALLSTASTATVIKNRLFSPAGVDIVVCTPHLLSSIAETDPNVLSRVSHIVIDEADSLLDRSFAPITSGIIDKATPSLKQLILCSATIPRSLDSFLLARFPDMRRLVTPNLHAIPRRVQLSVVDIDKVPFQGNRDLACAQTLWEIGKSGVEDDEEGSLAAEKKIVVFVNEREKATELAEYLRTKGLDATALSRDSDARAQNEVLAAFTGAPLPAKTASSTATTAKPLVEQKGDAFDRAFSPPGPMKRSSGVKVLVMTDLGSRGIDTLLVKHVVLYDVPHTSIDFIHRLGRVGRMGRRGRGIVLVGKGDRRDVVREVREGMFRGSALI